MLKITQKTPEELQPYAKNNKRHPPEQIERIAQSITEYGFTQPIVIGKDGIVIVGHARLEAALRLGLETVPTVQIDATEHDERRLRLLDNKLSDLGEYDKEAIQEELSKLDDDDLWELFAPVLGAEFVDPNDTGEGFELSDADRAEYQNMTFVVSEFQKETITNALNIANGHLANKGINSQENGDAATHIAESFLKRLGGNIKF